MIERRPGNMIRCPICSRPFRTAAGLADHDAVKHRPAVRRLDRARLVHQARP